ncbi:MAG: hypothetical protein KKE20_03675 [Nanoarchaeota archaeon]|nr:hypothetical protein [Nanoarchaeota archaeon]
MPMSKKDLTKRIRDSKAELAALEEKCKKGGTKEDFILLTKMRKKLK